MPTDEPDTNRRQLSLHLPANVDAAIRRMASRLDLPLSRVALGFIRDGLREAGEFRRAGDTHSDT